MSKSKTYHWSVYVDDTLTEDDRKQALYRSLVEGLVHKGIQVPDSIPVLEYDDYPVYDKNGDIRRGVRLITGAFEVEATNEQ